MRESPTTLYKVKGSLNNRIESMKTRTKFKPMKGYAKLRLTLVIAAIQKKEATNADKKPIKIKGSNNNFTKNATLSKNNNGKFP